MKSMTVCAIAFLVGCAVGDDAPEVAETASALTGANGNVYVNFHRDRLLAGYAAATTRTAASSRRTSR